MIIVKQWKSMIPALAAAMLIMSCSSKTVPVASRNDIKGNWTLSSVTYEGLPANQQVKITLLDEGTDACLTGSTWKFPNNGNGSYDIISGAAGCVPGERNIVWSNRVENGQTFVQIKRLPGGVKAKNVEEGYRFKVISADDDAMQLQSEVDFEGRTVFINYSFSKL